MSNLARLCATMTAGFVVGATAWFFFVQSPVLIKFLGKAKVRARVCAVHVTGNVHKTPVLSVALEVVE